MCAKTFYLYDTHCHTSNNSSCGKSTAVEMVEAHFRQGYSGVILTDHLIGSSRHPADMPWAERSHTFFRAYKEAQKAGEKMGIKVFFGWEYGQGGNDFLTYGLSEEWLAQHEELKSMELPDYLKLVRESGGFAVHAHPFNSASWVPAIRLYPDLVDAVEIFNGHRSSDENRRACWYAEEFHLPVTSGSDSHFVENNRGCGVLSETPFNDISDYIRAVKERTLHVIRRSRPEA